MLLSSTPLGRVQGSSASLACRRPAQLRPALHPRGGLVCRAGLVEKMTAEQLEVAIAERSTVLVVDFYATWCGPCVMLSKTLEEVASELGDAARFIKVDTDQETDLASQLQIEALPTLIFIPSAKDKKAYRTEGLLSAETVKKVISDLSA